MSFMLTDDEKMQLCDWVIAHQGNPPFIRSPSQREAYLIMPGGSTPTLFIVDDPMEFRIKMDDANYYRQFLIHHYHLLMSRLLVELETEKAGWLA